MDQTLVLWVLGIAFAVIGVLGNRILRSIDRHGEVMGEQGELLARMDVAIRGVNGDNGIVGDVRQLRAKQHETTNEVHALKGRVALVERFQERSA